MSADLQTLTNVSALFEGPATHREDSLVHRKAAVQVGQQVGHRAASRRRRCPWAYVRAPRRMTAIGDASVSE